VLQYQETVDLITALCYEEGKNYLDTETGNIGIVGHVEASTEEVSTVTVLPPLEWFGPQTLKLPSF
jgi:hypothetical protein